MNENKLNHLISNARGYYKKKKYKKACAMIENISDSDKLILDANEQKNLTLLRCLIYMKLNRYYECFHYILPLFVKTPHQADLIAQTKEIFSQEGIHRVIYVNLPIIKTEKLKTFLGLTQNVKDTSEKGRCLMILFLSVTKNYAYLDYLAEELRKYFPTNGFLRAEIKKKEKFQEDTVRLKKEQEDIESIKEKELTRELENIDEYIKAENYEELKDRLEDIIREAKKYNLNYLTMKAQDVYNQYKKIFPPEEKPEKRVEQELSIVEKPDFMKSPAMREFIEEMDPSFKDHYLIKGVELKRAGRLEEAIQAYDLALKLDPNYVGVLYNKGLALKELGRDTEAIQMFDKALMLDHRFKEVWYVRGTTLHELDQIEGALQAYDKALELDPCYIEVLINKGVALKWVGRLEEAIQAYDKALKVDSHLSAAWNNKGSVFEQLGRFEEALQAFDKAIELEPNNKSAYYGKKAVLQKQQQRQQQTKKKESELRINIDHAKGGGIKVATDLTAFMDKHYKKGIEYLNNNRFDMAIIEFKKSLKRDKDLSYVKYEQIGHCYSGKHEYLEAIKYYDMSLKAYPPSSPSQGSTLLSYNLLYNKALALKKIGRYDEAILDLNEALRQESGLSNAWILKSNCYGSKGESEEAIKCLDKALEIEPTNLLAWKNKASYLVDIGNEEKAHEILNELLTMEPIDFQSWCIRGEILIKYGNIREAMNCFNKALTLSEGHPYVHQYINKYKHLLNEKL
jgi:tetratricopeptide (TPR) repeat protein